jgi:hypothetical protein
MQDMNSTSDIRRCHRLDVERVLFEVSSYQQFEIDILDESTLKVHLMHIFGCAFHCECDFGVEQKNPTETEGGLVNFVDLIKEDKDGIEVEYTRLKNVRR